MNDIEKNKPKPKTSLAEKELDKAQVQFEKFDEEIKSMTMDRMNEAPKSEVEQQTKIAQRDMDKHPDIYLKPHRTISCREKFNEKYRSAYEFDKEYVHFIAENKEIKGEAIDMWTKPYAGVPAEWWKIPVNKPIWAPRFVAEQVKRKSYHRLVMQENQSAGSAMGGNAQFYGTMAVDTTVQRLDAIPVSSRKSIFMGASGF
jgi:hypothetical protein